jgi:hypothetical protein
VSGRRARETRRLVGGNKSLARRLRKDLRAVRTAPHGPDGRLACVWRRPLWQHALLGLRHPGRFDRLVREQRNITW